MDAAVARARRAMKPAGLDSDYDLAYEHFDVMLFLLQSRHLLPAGDVDPLQYFLDNGAGARSSPEVNFSMQSYLTRYPEKDRPGVSPYLDWLKHGKDAGEIADPAPGPEKMAPVLGMEAAELIKVLGDIRSDLRGRLRTGTLGEMFARAAEVEPLIGDVWTEAISRPSLRWSRPASSTRSRLCTRASWLPASPPHESSSWRQIPDGVAGAGWRATSRTR